MLSLIHISSRGSKITARAAVTDLKIAVMTMARNDVSEMTTRRDDSVNVNLAENAERSVAAARLKRITRSVLSVATAMTAMTVSVISEVMSVSSLKSLLILKIRLPCAAMSRLLRAS